MSRQYRILVTITDYPDTNVTLNTARCLLGWFSPITKKNAQNLELSFFVRIFVVVTGTGTWV